MLTQIEKSGKITAPGRGENSNTDQLTALANLGKKVSSAAFNFAGKKRTEEGSVDGAKAGYDAAKSGKAPEKKGGFFGSIYNDSFNTAQQGAYLSSLDRTSTERLSAIAKENDQDAEAFDAISNKYINTVVGGVDPEYQAALRESLETTRSASVKKINNAVVDQSRKEASDEFTKSFDHLFETASQGTRNGDLDLAEQSIAKAEIVAAGKVFNGDWSEAEGKIAVEGLRKEVYRQGNKKDILDLAETDSKKALTQLDEMEKEVPPLYTPDEWESTVDDMRRDVMRKIPKTSAASKARATQYMKNTKEVVSLGFNRTDLQKKQDEAVFAASDNLEEYRTLQQQEKFALMSSDDRNGLLKNLSSSNNRAAQILYVEQKQMHERIKTMAEDDGMGLYLRQQGPNSLPPANDYEARADLAADLSAFHGVQVSPFTVPEIEAEVSNFNQMTILEKVDMTVKYGDRPETYGQFAEADAPMFAMLSARGDPKVSGQVFNGQELLDSKQVQSPSAAEYLAAADSFIGRAGEVYGTEDREIVLDAALAHYAATVGQREGLDNRGFKKSLEAVTGGIGSVNGRRIELPRNVSEDQVDSLISDMQPETIEELGGLFKDLQLSRFQDGQLISKGINIYQVEIDIDENGNGVRLVGKDGRFFEIEITPELVNRNDARIPGFFD
jgi:hypothetical protein